METQFYTHIANGHSEKLSLLFQISELVAFKTVFEQPPQVSPINNLLYIQKKLLSLRQEHRVLDKTIAELSQGSADALYTQRCKKRKLALKDEIKKLESLVLPDIIA